MTNYKSRKTHIRQINSRIKSQESFRTKPKTVLELIDDTLKKLENDQLENDETQKELHLFQNQKESFDYSKIILELENKMKMKNAENSKEVEDTKSMNRNMLKL